jgi:hypothetical protein
VIPDSLMLKYYPEISKNSKTDISLSELTESYSHSVLRWENTDWIQVARQH